MFENGRSFSPCSIRAPFQSSSGFTAIGKVDGFIHKIFQEAAYTEASEWEAADPFYFASLCLFLFRGDPRRLTTQVALILLLPDKHRRYVCQSFHLCVARSHSFPTPKTKQQPFFLALGLPSVRVLFHKSTKSETLRRESLARRR